ncbi:MAG: hypothetical protein M0P77_03960 [Firmicutes bacterium]|nr:hypothetical protein [Bacillota bacterium]
MIKFSIIILLFGVFLDFFAHQGISLISINENYIYYVHTTITTVAATSTTILTIIVNSFAEKIYGFSIKEIANYNNEYFKGYQITHVALFSILISAIVLALGLINTLVAILVIVVILISSADQHTWKLISDDQFCLESVLREIDIVAKRCNTGELEHLLLKK